MADGLLQHGGAGLEVAAGRGVGQRGHGAAAHVVLVVLVHRRATFGAVAQGLVARKVHQLAGGLVLLVTEIEFELPVVVVGAELEHQLGGERPTRFGTEALQRPNVFVAQKGLGLVHLERAPAGRFAKREATAVRLAIGPGAGVAAVVFFDDTATHGARAVQCGVVARYGVAVVFLGFLDDMFRHGGNVAHEGLAAELTAFHQRQLVLPLAGQRRFTQFLHAQAAQQRHQLKGFGGGDEFAPFAQHVFFVEQAFNDGRAGGGGAQAFVLHGAAQFVVLDQLARALHRPQQSGFAVTRGGAGLEGLGHRLQGLHSFTRLHGHQVLAFVAFFGIDHFVGGFLAIHRQPARLDQHLAFGLEMVRGPRHLHLADAGGDLELGHRKEHRQEAAHHQIVELLFGLVEAAGHLRRGDDGKVVADLAVVEHALAGAQVALP